MTGKGKPVKLQNLLTEVNPGNNSLPQLAYLVTERDFCLRSGASCIREHVEGDQETHAVCASTLRT